MRDINNWIRFVTFLEEIKYVMSLLKTQFVIDSETNLEENVYQNEHDKSDCIRRPNARSTVEKNDTESDIHDFHLRGIIMTLKNYVDIITYIKKYV